MTNDFAKQDRIIEDFPNTSGLLSRFGHHERFGFGRDMMKIVVERVKEEQDGGIQISVLIYHRMVHHRKVSACSLGASGHSQISHNLVRVEINLLHSPPTLSLILKA